MGLTTGLQDGPVPGRARLSVAGTHPSGVPSATPAARRAGPRPPSSDAGDSLEGRRASEGGDRLVCYFKTEGPSGVGRSRDGPEAPSPRFGRRVRSCRGGGTCTPSVRSVRSASPSGTGRARASSSVLKGKGKPRPRSLCSNPRRGSGQQCPRQAWHGGGASPRPVLQDTLLGGRPALPSPRSPRGARSRSLDIVATGNAAPRCRDAEREPLSPGRRPRGLTVAPGPPGPRWPASPLRGQTPAVLGQRTCPLVPRLGRAGRGAG